MPSKAPKEKKYFKNFVNEFAIGDFIADRLIKKQNPENLILAAHLS